ncbi:sec14 cytosolic factor family protein [Schizosaccharomyces japonicus yFS275]|uniref:Sec14 cytosolic factor family protein n=1 Tax=Schizosaccharomyces japonicus (strain yFS275 / FY16936) TaxID=402676 RepID=B6K2U2_SCHJY|nr:sec14 cytosolic factor family protein [Schizosaccharomyces japonicus yFS275]EEB08582.1 sec14 cytosolic factor family protein [Schizosaccharomyces japonicus yFS275]
MPEGPGRLGNLTPEQEALLKQFWKKMFEFFELPLQKRSDSFSSAKSFLSDSSAVSFSHYAASVMSSSTKPSISTVPVGSMGPALKPVPTNASGRTSKSTSKNSSKGSGKSKSHKSSKVKKNDTEGRIHKVLSQWTPTELRNAFWEMIKTDNPDALLLRFLRARKWDLQAAVAMFLETMQWRFREMNVTDILKNADHLKDDKDFLFQLRIGKCFIYGEDLCGRPICYIRSRLHKLNQVSQESVERLTVWVMETARLLLKPPVETATVVFDMTDFSMSNMDYAPLKFMIKCLEAHYPECLGVCIVHKAPWLFQGVWQVIKTWLDPVVVSKVKFTRNAKDLQQFIKTDYILKELGGPNPWSYTYPEPCPSETEGTRDTVTRDKLKDEKNDIAVQYERATIDWIMGYTDPAEVKGKRTQLASELKDAYWRLDKYVRGPSVYDRMGLISPNPSCFPTKEYASKVSRSRR